MKMVRFGQLLHGAPPWVSGVAARVRPSHAWRKILSAKLAVLGDQTPSQFAPELFRAHRRRVLCAVTCHDLADQFLWWTGGLRHDILASGRANAKSHLKGGFWVRARDIFACTTHISQASAGCNAGWVLDCHTERWRRSAHYAGCGKCEDLIIPLYFSQYNRCATI